TIHQFPLLATTTTSSKNEATGIQKTNYEVNINTPYQNPQTHNCSAKFLVVFRMPGVLLRPANLQSCALV
ncbi:hypothetical protein, partial [Undibacterium sp. TS12]|uniref:hypothetical protein n=1 Tax=Undibacterium sp. TS12 TaxID=2908202 RepID=UPI001F4C7205